MSIPFYSKNNNYLISKRDYSEDYSNEKSLDIDMTMSGKYLSKYPKFVPDNKKLCEYPSHKDVEDLELAIQKKLNISDEIVIGSGSNGLLQNIIKILFADGGNLVTPYLSFNQVEFAVASMKGITKRVYMKDYRIDFDNILKSIDKNTKMIYICNPNNPTGYLEVNEDIIKLAKQVSVPVIVDESAIEFSNGKSIVEMTRPNNIYIVRTFSKAYGMANLRVGYMICNKKFKQIYNKNITINEVSGVSCQMALEMLKTNYYLENVKKIEKEKMYLLKNLKKLNIECFDSKSNTILTKTTFSKSDLSKLRKNRISIVPVSYQDNSQHIRIAIQEHETNKLFINKLMSIWK